MVSAVRISAHRKYPLAKDLIFGHGLTPNLHRPPFVHRWRNAKGIQTPIILCFGFVR